jgi:methylated-DNA-[protein]-cysteine S-methyltransferase
MTSIEFEALRARADEASVDVEVARVDTPVGLLLLAAVDGAVVRVAFDTEGHDAVLVQLAGSISPRIIEHESPVLAAAAEQLRSWFAGERCTFDLPLDLRLARGPFRREVLEQLQAIQLGETRTYAELAAAAGRPTAVRAVGSGCATNPLPVIVPCHRVLRTGGELGGYLGGLDRKRWLLDHEARLIAG